MTQNTIRNLLYFLIIIILVASFLGLSGEKINIIVDLFTNYILIGAITSLVVGNLVEALTGDYLKDILLNIEICGIKFSVSAFFVTVIILKFFIFK